MIKKLLTLNDKENALKQKLFDDIGLKIVGLKSYSLGAGSAALLFLFLPLPKLLHARPQGERVVLSVGKIIFIIFKVEPFDIEHAPSVCFCLLIPFHFLLPCHNTFNKIRLGYFTYALSII